jgi:hypothetical protein
MARLASLARAGYYPSPDPVATAVGRFVSPPKSGGAFRVLDPCCADGAAVMRFLEGMDDSNAETFGIEVHAPRAEAAERVSTMSSAAMLAMRDCRTTYSNSFTSTRPTTHRPTKLGALSTCS